MIYGIGIDLIEVERIARQVDSDSRFKEKIFSRNEIEYCESFKVNKAQHYAARFAAKEAFFKAIGTGYRGGLAFHEISIENDDLGRPEVVLSGETEKLSAGKMFTKIHVSMSHLQKYASAIIVIETDDK